MRVEFEKKGDCDILLRVELDEAEVEKALSRASEELAREVNIPGFRKGKAPRRVVETFLGRETILRRACERIIPEVCENFIKERDLKVFSAPEIKEVNLEPLSFEAMIYLEPVVELGEYGDIRVEEEKPEVSEEEIEEALLELRRRYASWKSTDRESREGDLLILDVEGRVGERVVLERKEWSYRLKEDAPQPAEGFFGKVLGIKKGEEREFSLPLPDNFLDGELRGKECLFKVVARDVREEKLPEIDEEFLKFIGMEREELISKIREELLREKEAISKRNVQDKALDILLERSKVSFPSVMLEREKERLKREGKENPEEEAVKIIKRTLILTKLCEKENIRVEGEELEKEIENMAGGNRALRKFLSSPEMLWRIKNNLLLKKGLERLYEIAVEKGKENQIK